MPLLIFTAPRGGGAEAKCPSLAFYDSGSDVIVVFKPFTMLRTVGTALPRRLQTTPLRRLSVSATRFDIRSNPQELEELITPRAKVDKLRKEYEEKYGDKLKNKVKA